MTADLPNSPPHGFRDDPATRRLLRGRPPQRALAWAADALGGGTVTSVRALRGGLSSAMHLLTVTTPEGGSMRAVLRRYVRPDLNIEEPDIADREQRALRVAASLAVPTPAVIACDPTGAAAGVPALLMSRLPGRVNWAPSDTEQWLRRLAEALPAIHAAPLPAHGVIQLYTPYRQRSYDPPSWARREALWRRAVDIFHASTPAGPLVFVHRDYHPGNVLWRRGAVSGIVDWQSASIGSPSVDVGHCRANLLRYGQPVADRFTRMWEQNSGARYDPWADIVSTIDWLDDLRNQPAHRGAIVEDFLARAVAALNPHPR